MFRRKDRRYGPRERGAVTIVRRIDLESVFLETRGELERVMRRRVHPLDIATDLLHDVYLKCRHATIDFPDRTEARAYLLRMASNLAIDHSRTEQRRAAILNDMAPIYDGYDTCADTPEAHALAGDQLRRVEAVLADLPGLTRQMFVLARLQGMTHKEVADTLGVSKSLVDKYMVQALLRCRDALGGLDRLD